MSDNKADVTLVGKFSDADVKYGGLIKASLAFDDRFNSITVGKQTYNFVDSDGLSATALETLEAQENTFVFDGDLSNLIIELDKHGILALPIHADDKKKLTENFIGRVTPDSLG